jgi:hypothetical protein
MILNFKINLSNEMAKKKDIDKWDRITAPNRTSPKTSGELLRKY